MSDVPPLPSSQPRSSQAVAADIDRWAAYRTQHGEAAVAEAVKTNAVAVATSFGWDVEYLVLVIRAYWARVSDANPVKSGSGLAGIRSNLKNLGIMNGRTEADFVKALGRKPTSISTVGPNLRLLQFRSGRYSRAHIAVVFNATDHRFVKVSSRYQC